MKPSQQIPPVPPSPYRHQLFKAQVHKVETSTGGHDVDGYNNVICWSVKDGALELKLDGKVTVVYSPAAYEKVVMSPIEDL